MKLLIRADASSRVGAGHVMRCLALAHAARRAALQVAFAFTEMPHTLRVMLQASVGHVERIRAQGGGSADAEATVAIARREGASWIVVDGYEFNDDFRTTMYASRQRILEVDDLGFSRPSASALVVNPNVYAAKELYPSYPAERLLLGPRFVLFREEFISWADQRRPARDRVSQLLVTLGDADRENVTHKVIDALTLLQSSLPCVTVVVGSSNPNRASIELVAKRIGAQVLTSVRNMPELMASADLAISAGGVTAAELCFMGVPTVIVTTADNQRPNARAMHDGGLAVTLGWHRELSPIEIAHRIRNLLQNANLRRRLAARAQHTFDGRGADRVIAVMQHAVAPAADVSHLTGRRRLLGT